MIPRLSALGRLGRCSTDFEVYLFQGHLPISSGAVCVVGPQLSSRRYAYLIRTKPFEQGHKADGAQLFIIKTAVMARDTDQALHGVRLPDG